MRLSEAPDALLRQVIEKSGRNVFVVMNKAGTTVLKDPGMDMPYHVRNKKIAEKVARESGGVAVDLETAIKQLEAHYKSRAND